MKKRIWLAFAVLVPVLYAQQEDPSSAGFTGDRAAIYMDQDSMKVERKESSWFWETKMKNPKDQFAWGEELLKRGSRRSARVAFDELVREWHASPEAAKAQMEVAAIYEENGNLERAYEEYLYLVVYFAGQCPYNTVLDKCFQLANAILHDNKSILGFTLASNTFHRENFERILYYAPRWYRAPEVLIIIGALHEDDGNFPLAAKVYDTIVSRFPNSSQCEDAVYRSAFCHYSEANIQKENEARCRDSIMAIRALLARFPNHPRKGEIQKFYDELNVKLELLNYNMACFYDSKQRNEKAARTAYERFIREFPDSQRVPAIRQRLSELPQ